VAQVTLENIVKKFGETLAVNDVSLSIADGEFLVLLGPSGCGKTTTLNMIAGLERPTSGQISIGGQRVEKVPPDKRDIAMVFQSIALYPHMTVYQNIAFPLRMARVAKAETARRVREVAQLLRIDELLDRKPYQLSGGQRQRVALGRCVVRQPAVFLFDEPLSSLDAKLRVDMRVEVKKLHERLRATFVYVTHDQVEAMTMADRVALMDGGKLIQLGEPGDIYQRPANKMVAGFIGSPGMNFLQGRLTNNGGSFSFEAPGLSIALPADLPVGSPRAGNDSITLGIRPESVRLGDGTHTAASIQGNVFATEPVGSDLFLDISFEDGAAGVTNLFKVRTLPNLRVHVGERIPLQLPYESIFFFDAAGWRVYPN
jgi:multiple sugar transport system ATP-binding protein